MPKRKVTAEILDEIINLIGMGINMEEACNYTGISKDTFDRVIKLPHRYKRYIPNIENYVEKCRKAKLKAKIFHVSNVFKQAQEHPNLSTWWLERVYPDEFGKKEQQTLRTIPGEPFEIKGVIAKDEILAIIEKYREAFKTLERDDESEPE